MYREILNFAPIVNLIAVNGNIIAHMMRTIQLPLIQKYCRFKLINSQLVISLFMKATMMYPESERPPFGLILIAINIVQDLNPKKGDLYR